MATPRPFRFGVQISRAESGADWIEKAKKAEGLGYDILLMPDHLAGQLAIGPALATVASVTTLRVGTLVWQNDLRHPALLAQEVATLDLLSNGRFELGIGAGGSYLPDYELTGIHFAPPADRVTRLAEAIPILKGLFADGPLTYAGRHYTITGYDGLPKPVQRPHPPLFIGGGGPRVLRLAAREADIIGLIPAMLPAGGTFQLDGTTAAKVGAQVDILRQAAGDRFADIELNILLQRLVVTDDPRAASEEVSQEWTPLTPEEVLGSPHILIGSIDGIVQTLQERRETLGISYIVVFERDLEPFAPVVSRLSGA